MPQAQGFSRKRLLFLTAMGAATLGVAVVIAGQGSSSAKPTLTLVTEETNIIEQAQAESDGPMITTVDVINPNPTPGDQLNFAGVILAGRTSPLLAFNEEDYANAAFSDRLVILYFYSDTCASCAKEFTQIENVFGSMTHKRVVGFRIMMNDETSADNTGDEFAKRLGITKAGTKILLHNGRTLGKTANTWDAQQYLAEIEVALKD